MDLPSDPTRLISIMSIFVGSFLFIFFGCAIKKSGKNHQKRAKIGPISKISQLSKKSEREEAVRVHETTGSSENPSKEVVVPQKKKKKKKAKTERKKSDRSKEESRESARPGSNEADMPNKRSKELVGPAEAANFSAEPTEKPVEKMASVPVYNNVEVSSMPVYTARCPPAEARSVPVYTARPTQNGNMTPRSTKINSVEAHDGGYEKCGDLSMDELKKIADGIP